jgi:hypothetical protein
VRADRKLITGTTATSASEVTGFNVGDGAADPGAVVDGAARGVIDGVAEGVDGSPASIVPVGGDAVGDDEPPASSAPPNARTTTSVRAAAAPGSSQPGREGPACMGWAPLRGRRRRRGS